MKRTLAKYIVMESIGSGENIPLIGRQVGSFVVQRLLGEGGMGEVYELVHPGIKKRLAMKILHREYANRPEIVQRFFDEARAVNLIDHPNIVDIIDFQTLDDGRPYLTMEFLEGEALTNYLAKHQPISTDVATTIMMEIGAALGAAHSSGIIHRDLKPDNIFLQHQQDGSYKVKVLDFGVAKLQASLKSGDGEATQTGAVLGTPRYMSPEQAAGKPKEIDARSDIYSMGVLLYEMLSGQLPFDGSTFAELILKHLHENPLPIQEHRPNLNHAWDDLLSQAMAKDKNQRFRNVSDFLAALDAANAIDRPTSKPKYLGYKLVPLIALPVGLAIGFFLLKKTPTQKNSSNTEQPSATSSMPLPFEEARDTPKQPATINTPESQDSISSISKPIQKKRPPVEQSKEKKTQGTLVVKASPWAIVYLDGKRLGQTPIQKSVTAGAHKIKLVNESEGTTRTKKIRVKPEGKTPMSFNMYK